MNEMVSIRQNGRNISENMEGNHGYFTGCWRGNDVITKQSIIGLQFYNAPTHVVDHSFCLAVFLRPVPEAAFY